MEKDRIKHVYDAYLKDEKIIQKIEKNVKHLPIFSFGTCILEEICWFA